MTDLEIYTAVIEHPDLEFIQMYSGGSIHCTNVWCDDCPLYTTNGEIGNNQLNCHTGRSDSIMANLSALEFQYKASK